jgi:hypothetical protein
MKKIRFQNLKKRARARAVQWTTAALMSVLLTQVSCTGVFTKTPELGAYTFQGQRLIDTSARLSLEEDVPRLHQVAQAMDASRTLACDDYNGECSGFADFLTAAMRSAKKGTLTPEERADLLTRARLIREAVETGRKKLKAQPK